MDQVVAKAGGVEVIDVPVPTNGDNEVLVANAFSVVSTGTETITIERTEPRSYLDLVKDPELAGKVVKKLRGSGVQNTLDAVKESRAPQNLLGYSSAGIVLAVGKEITDISPGDKVACAGAGVANHAEVIAVPRNLVAKVPASVALDAAAFATLGAIATHGIRRVGAQFGETLAIVGTGLIGLLGVQIARAAGMKVVAIDRDPARVELAKSLGADVAIAIETPDDMRKFLAATDGRGADAVVVFASGTSSEAVRLASRLARDRGRLVVVGMVGMEMERGVLYEKELDIAMSRSYGPGRYDPSYEEKGVDYPLSYVRWTENRNMQSFLRFLETGQVSVSKLIGETYPISDAKLAYGSLLSPEKKVISVLFKYQPEKYVAKPLDLVSSQVQVPTPKPVSGGVKVGLVGAGKFAKEFILPNISRIPEFHLVRLVTSSPVNARQTAEKYGFGSCGTEFADILQDTSIDLVVVATPHNLHAEMVLRALRAGKRVFTEKPLCLTLEELDEISKAVKETGLPVYVGFNRRYSPMALKAKDLLRTTPGPFLINYRVNAGHIPISHWLQDPKVGGGRIIGECGHFIDFFQFLIGSKATSMKVSSIPSGKGNVVSHDNFIATVSWEDGSVSSLTYTSLGSNLLPKERIEIFAGSKNIIIDDFKLAEFPGYPEPGIALKRQDKGHSGEFEQLAKALQGKESSMISFGEACDATRLTIMLDSMVRSSLSSVESSALGRLAS